MTENSKTFEWLLKETYHQPFFDNLFFELCERLVEEGIHVDRSVLYLRTLHPQFHSALMRWYNGGESAFITAPHEITVRDVFINSPLWAISIGQKGTIRRRLFEPKGPPEDEYPIFDDLREEGFTDYLAHPMIFVSGQRHAVTYATKAPGGFSDRDLETLEKLQPVLTMASEIRLNRRIAKNLLNTYVGTRSGERILAGEINRGSGETIEAAIWYSDLRSFTELSEELSRSDIIDYLNHYFDVMAEPIEKHGGEILKFVGDAVLAIFELSEDKACSRALSAALEARKGMWGLNKEREDAGLTPIGFGLSLHIGEVIWGNIGSQNRLDFTVIGSAINISARIEQLTKSLGHEFLMSEKFAESCVDMRPYLHYTGEHQLKGVSKPIRVYAAPKDW